MNDQEAPLTPDVQPQIVPEQQPVTVMSPETPQRSSLKVPVIIIVILFVLAGAGFLGYSFLFKQEKTSGQGAVPTPSAIEPTKPTVGQYTGSSSITLRDVTSSGYSGSAHRSVIPNYIFRSVHATLPDPPEGQFYQFWIAKQTGDLIPIARLFKDFEGMYSFVEGGKPLRANSTFNDLSNTMVVSLESQDDENMETRLLEGTFTK